MKNYRVPWSGKKKTREETCAGILASIEQSSIKSIRKGAAELGIPRTTMRDHMNIDLKVMNWFAIDIHDHDCCCLLAVSVGIAYHFHFLISSAERKKGVRETESVESALNFSCSTLRASRLKLRFFIFLNRVIDTVH
ncbi:hypothetical protein C0J52_10109 [Blattella germanica]|nr:hypothetical protein C0J52_10109 [Blattella germanica]